MTPSTGPAQSAARTEPAARAARAARHQGVRALGTELRQRTGEQHVPTSALVRRLLRRALAQAGPAPLSPGQVEDIARRVAREELHR